MIMSNDLKEKAGLIYNIVESVVLAMSVGLMVWLANVVIDHGNSLAAHAVRINGLSTQTETIEQHGSRAVETLSGRVDSIAKQLDEMKASILALQTAPGELKAINIRLDGLKEGQGRMEKMMDEHFKQRP